MIGHHILIDLYECNVDSIKSLETVEIAIQKLADQINAKVLRVYVHEFIPHGYSCIAQISTSHIALHTWPELQFVAIDIFSCSSQINVGASVSLARDLFGSRRVVYQESLRGSELSTQSKSLDI